MINIDKLRNDLLSDINGGSCKFTGDENSDERSYSIRCLDNALKWIEDNETILVSGGICNSEYCSNKSKRQERIDINKYKRECKAYVSNNTEGYQPVGFVGGLLGVWILQAIVGWIVRRLFDRLFFNKNENNDKKLESDSPENSGDFRII